MLRRLVPTGLLEAGSSTTSLLPTLSCRRAIACTLLARFSLVVDGSRLVVSRTAAAECGREGRLLIEFGWAWIEWRLVFNAAIVVVDVAVPELTLGVVRLDVVTLSFVDDREAGLEGASSLGGAMGLDDGGSNIDSWSMPLAISSVVFLDAVRGFALSISENVRLCRRSSTWVLCLSWRGVVAASASSRSCSCSCCVATSVDGKCL